VCAEVQETFRRARGGEKEAVEELQRLFAKEQFPGLDIDVLKQVANAQTFDRLLGEALAISLSSSTTIPSRA
jgi:hypothetical protein